MTDGTQLPSGQDAPGKGQDPTAARRASEAGSAPHWLVACVAVLLVAVVVSGVYAFSVFLEGRRAEPDPQLAVLQATFSADPESAESGIALAYALQERGKLKDAVRVYEDVLVRESTNLAALYNRGVCLMKLGHERRAEESLSKVLQLAPEHALAAKALGEYYLSIREHHEIYEAVAPALAAHPQMADLHALTGVALEADGRYDEAKAAYIAALRFDPQQETALDGMARMNREVQ
jgi:tetratricopeptide (TPR) repeat protein